jgi:hypothetical protein
LQQGSNKAFFGSWEVYMISCMRFSSRKCAKKLPEKRASSREGRDEVGGLEDSGGNL